MNGRAGWYEKAMDMAQRIGPVFGFLVGLFYSSAYVIYFLKDRDLSNLAQAAFGLGFGFAAAGLGRGQKKQTEIIVASESEKRLDPKNTLTADSVVPEIQREMVKQSSNRKTKD
jgi:hypothetical protein